MEPCIQERTIGQLEARQDALEKRLEGIHNDVRNSARTTNEQLAILPARVADIVASRKTASGAKKDENGNDYRKLWITLLLAIVTGIAGWIVNAAHSEPKSVVSQVQQK